MVRRRAARAASLLGALGAALAAGPRDAGVCVSKAGRPAFERHGEAPAATAAPLGACHAYRGETCCDRAHGDAARRAVLHLADAPDACRNLWEKLECSVCAPEAGTAAAAQICAPFCDKLFAACASEFFAAHPQTQLLGPCRSTDQICTRAREWVGTGAEFCELAGFAVVDAPKAKAGGPWCFNGTQPRPPPTSRASGSRGTGASTAAGKKGAVQKFLDTWWPLLIIGAMLAYLKWRDVKRQTRRSMRMDDIRRSAEAKMAMARERQQNELDQDVQELRRRYTNS